MSVYLVIMKKKTVNKTIEKIHNKVKSFANSEDYMNYLKFIKKFHYRSFNNQVLIMMYKPTSKYVMGYKQWIDKFNRIPVACIECRAIAVKDCNCKERVAPVRIPQLAPIPYEKENSKGELEEKIWFKDVFVFDLEDTEPLPDLPIKEIHELIKEVNIPIDFEKLEPVLRRIIEKNKFTLRYKSLYQQGLGGWTDFLTKEIVVKEQTSDSDKIHTLLHEIGHMFAHDRETLGDMLAPRQQRECEAESIAFVVADYLGMDTSCYSVGYITSWIQGEENILTDSFKMIAKTSNRIIDEIEEIGEIK